MAKLQDRVELKGSSRRPMPGGQDVGPADPHQHIEVSVLLRRGSKPELLPQRLPRWRRSRRATENI